MIKGANTPSTPAITGTQTQGFWKLFLAWSSTLLINVASVPRLTMRKKALVLLKGSWMALSRKRINRPLLRGSSLQIAVIPNKPTKLKIRGPIIGGAQISIWSVILEPTGPVGRMALTK